MHVISSQTVKWSLIGITLIVVALVSISAFAQGNKSEKHDIGWSLDSIQKTLQPGQTVMLPVTFTSDKTKSNISVVVSPEIAPYVTVQPATINEIQKGKPVSLTVYLNATSTASFRTVAGVIKLVEVKAKKKVLGSWWKWNNSTDVVAKPLPVRLKITHEARTPVVWQPAHVKEQITINQVKTITTTLSSSWDINQQVFISVAPELQSLITVTPNEIQGISSNNPVTVNVAFYAASGSIEGNFSGAIQLHLGSPEGRVLPTPLPMEVIVCQCDPIPLPPDPGEAGKTTLAGIDSDGDGVRDDVQRYIALNVTDSALHQEALKQVAKASQQELLATLATSKSEAVLAAYMGVRSIECLSYLGLREQDRWKEIESLMINTEERLLALERFNDMISGEIFESLPYGQKRAACSFDVENFPN